MTSIYEQVADERHRAHLKHGYYGFSVENKSYDYALWLPILTEEVGEVARALCDDSPVSHLRSELIQVAAMACAWAEACDRD